jgi:hypothetical protein
LEKPSSERWFFQFLDTKTFYDAKKPFYNLNPLVYVNDTFNGSINRSPGGDSSSKYVES